MSVKTGTHGTGILVRPSRLARAGFFFAGLRRQTPIEYTRKASRAPQEPLVQPSLSLSRSVKNIGIRKLIRQGLGRRLIEKISRRQLVKASTYREYERRIEEYARKRKRAKHST